MIRGIEGRRPGAVAVAWSLVVEFCKKVDRSSDMDTTLRIVDSYIRALEDGKVWTKEMV